MVKKILKHTLEEQENRLLIISSPLVFMHLACIGIFFTGFSWVAVWALLITYFIRVFALTAGFHRYFSHRSFKTSRFFQFVLAWLGTSAAQMGPMWWAAHHRHHHQHSDTEEDVHSPVAKMYSGRMWDGFYVKLMAVRIQIRSKIYINILSFDLSIVGMQYQRFH